VAFAAEAGIDLIVMGTHGRGGLVHMLLGSVTEKVVRAAPCPVLTVREHQQAPAETGPAPK
jgi:nucleotide-binding universal stress UspA family protein